MSGPDAAVLDGFALAVLAGGRATRYGGLAKGMLPLPDGGTVLARTLAAARAAGLSHVLVVANDEVSYRGCGCPVIPDRHPDAGPLGGVEAALVHLGRTCRHLAVLPCDVPAFGEVELRRLVDAYRGGTSPLVVAETPDGLWHPLCAILSSSLLQPIADAVGRRELSVNRLWRRLGAVSVRYPDHAPFLNLNSPADMERLPRRAGGRSS